MFSSSRHVVLAAALAGASPAVAEVPDGLESYGFLNLGVLEVDDGARSETYFGENSNAPSRIGVLYSVRTGRGVELKFNLEMGFGLRGTSAFNAANDDFKIDINRSSLRKAEVIIVTEKWGTFSIGQGDMASEGSAGSDLSGTGVVHGVAVADLGGGTEFLRSDGTASGTTVDDAFAALDGFRRYRVRYDTPRFGGFQVSAAFGREVLRAGNNNDYVDVALGYTGETDKLALEGKVTHEWVDSSERNLVASAALLHKPTGLNVAVASGRRQVGVGGYRYIKIGLTRDDVLPYGQTSFAVDLYDGKDVSGLGDRSKAVSFGVTQKIDRLNLEVFAAHRRFEYRSGVQTHRDISATFAGARWRF